MSLQGNIEFCQGNKINDTMCTQAVLSYIEGKSE